MTTANSSADTIHRNEQLMLFEGIVIGIYGNWLVSLIQLISFTASLIAVQILLTLMSLLSLVALLAIGVFGGKFENHYVVMALAFLHFFPLCVTLAMESLWIKDGFFLMIGGVLFFMIYMAEHTRARSAEREKHQR
jgi:hypothetical membrane protein